MSIKEIALELNRSVYAVKNTASRMGVTTNNRRRWEKSEESYLIKNYHITPIEDICKNLKRKKKAIIAKASKLGLSEKKTKRRK